MVDTEYLSYFEPTIFFEAQHPTTSHYGHRGQNHHFAFQFSAPSVVNVTLWSLFEFGFCWVFPLASLTLIFPGWQHVFLEYLLLGGLCRPACTISSEWDGSNVVPLWVSRGSELEAKRMTRIWVPFALEVSWDSAVLCSRRCRLFLSKCACWTSHPSKWLFELVCSHFSVIVSITDLGHLSIPQWLDHNGKLKWHQSTSESLCTNGI